ncbi:MAG: hypothetical protein ACOYO1_14795 [Bacteroidales bacterium]
MEKITNIWQVAGPLLGFQLTAFSFRINSELNSYDRTNRWFPPADWSNILSMFITVCFVFCIPIAQHNYDLSIVTYWFGLALILFLFYPIALIGHYELFYNLHLKINHIKLVRKWLLLFLQLL